MINNNNLGNNGNIAIIGIGCRFPGGLDSPEKFYNALLEKKCFIVPAQEERKPLFDSGDSDYCRKAGFLSEDINLFDNKCFGASQLEAERMDPCQKLMLTVCREAFEDAGCRIDSLSGSNTGVYVGSSTEEYVPVILDRKHRGLMSSSEDITGMLHGFLSGKVSYAFGMHGPSVTINTACSTSVTTLHQAVIGLNSHDCDMAVAGAVSIMLLSEITDQLSLLNILSKSCSVRAFDKSADGTVRGEGAVAVVLKRLDDAVRDKDNIYAVIMASGLNQDGRSAGITAPYGLAQENLIRKVWDKAGVSAKDIDYIETHGTGTKLGDAIEISSLADVVKGTDRNNPIYIGSVKPNIGHLESASGLAGIIKAIMIIRHKCITPEINFDVPSEQIDWNSTVLKVNTEPVQWEKPKGSPRIACVSSFGLSGTNGHIVLSEYISDSDEYEVSDYSTEFVKFSAETENGLKNQLKQMKKICSNISNEMFTDFVYSQNVIRSDFHYRTYIRAKNISELSASVDSAMMKSYYPCKERRRVIALFTGQGSQFAGMMNELYKKCSVFRKCFDRCNKVYLEIKGNDLREICFSGDEKVNITEFSQPAIFAVEISLFETMKSFGVEFNTVIGHSIGEYTAACVAGIFSIEDCMRIVIKRGELMNSTKRQGAMLAVSIGADEIRCIAEKSGVYIAASNSSSQTVLSGEKEKLEKLADTLKQKNVKCTFLNVSNGFHSALMDEILEPFRKVFDGVKLCKPSLRIISNVTGKNGGKDMMNVDYWVKHIRSEVKFADGIKSIRNPEENIFLEIGAKPVLSALIEKCFDKPVDTVFMNFGNEKDTDVLKEACFNLYSLGVNISWEKFYNDEVHKKLRLPAFAYDMKSFSILKDYSFSANIETVENTHKSFTKEQISQIVKQIVTEKLDIDISKAKENDSLLVYGISSVLVLQASAYINNYFGVRLGLDSLMENCTLSGWTELISSKMKSGFDEHSNITAVAEPVEHIGIRFPLTKIQEAYFVGRCSEMLWGGTGCYAGFEIDMENLDTDRFVNALKKTVERHEMLRCIITEDGEQYITENYEPKITIYRRSNIIDMEKHLSSVHDEIMTQVIPVGRPLWDMRITEMNDNEWRIHFGIDFIIADALSLNLFWSDMEKFYNGDELVPLNFTYYDYLKYTSENIDNNSFNDDKEYWYNKAKDFPESPQLPYCETDKTNLYKKFVRRSAVLSEEEYKSLVAKSGSQGLTVASVLLELFSEVLASRSSNKHFGIMLTTFRRENIHSDVNKIIGDFTNLMLTEINIDNSGVINNAKKIQSTIQHDYTHGLYSAIDFVKYINSIHGKQTIYPVVFTSAIGVGNAGNIFTQGIVSSASSTPQVFIDHQIYENADGGITLSWDTADYVFMPNVIDDMFEVYVNLVKKLCSKEFSDFSIDELRSKRDIAIQSKSNSTEKNIPECDMLTDFENICHKYPNKKAIICDDDSMTYGELLNFVKKTAGYICNKGLKKGFLAVVDMKKSCEQIGIIAGILYAGGIYIPVPYGQPVERTMNIIKKAQCDIIFRDEISDDLNNFVQITTEDVKKYSELAEKADISPKDSAYIIYTSGSTGEPKGVRISHDSAMNTIIDVIERYSIDNNDVIFGVSSVSFDLSVFDIFASINTGATLVIPSERKRTDPVFWHEYTEKYNVTIWNSVPSIMELYCDYMQQSGLTNNTIRRIILSGDWISVTLPEKIKSIFIKSHLTSMGGATEASIWSNYYECDTFNSSSRSVPYGYPLSNQSFYILDEYGKPCPQWVEGKLFIGGRGLAEGYHNAKELTEKAFIKSEIVGKRIYDTGDYGRYIEDGIIEFLGRKDQQVKINGYRIELGEICTAFRKTGISGEIQVIPVDDENGGRMLSAFIKRESNVPDENTQTIKESLGKLLPAYFIPETFIYVDSFPLTANGKLDRKKLADILKDYSNISQKEDFVSDDELLNVIRNALKRNDISYSDKFDSIGVSSMEIIRLANKLEQKFSLRPPIYEMMNGYSVKQLAEFYFDKENVKNTSDKTNESVEKYSRNGSVSKDIILRLYAKGVTLYTEEGKLKFRSKNPIEPDDMSLLKINKPDIIKTLENGFIPENETFPLADVQKAYLAGRADDIELGGVSAHYYTELEYDGELDINLFRKAVDTVVENQDMLRTVILSSGKQLVLGKSERVEIPLNNEPDENKLAEIRQIWSSYTFETGRFPMFHIEVSKFADKSIIHFSFDCMIFDGWSTELMFKQIFDVYNGKIMKPLSCTFRQFVENQNKEPDNDIDEFIKNMPPAPELPYALQFSEIKSPEFSRLNYKFTSEESDMIRKTAIKYGATLTVYMCAKYMQRISEWCGDKEFTLDLTLYNRPADNEDVARMIGDFTNITFISYHGSKYSSFADTVKDIQKQMWKAVDKRGNSGIKIINRISKNSPGKAMFPVVLTSLAGSGEDNGVSKLKELYSVSQTPQVALDFQLYERNGIITVVWDYVKQAFNEKEITVSFETYISDLLNGGLNE